MANLLIDGFDGVAVADLATVYNPSAVTSIVAGRNGNGVFMNSSINHLGLTIPANATMTAGAAVKVTSVAANQPIISFLDAGSFQAEVRLHTAGAIYVCRNATILATASVTWTAGVWMFVEFRATIHNTLGAYELRINGVPVATATNVDTQTTANAYATQVYLGYGLSSGQVQVITYDDYYINDNNGSVNNTFMGDGKVETIYPSAAGAYAEFTPLAGANYAAVDETTPDAETTYVESSTIGHRDTYTFGDLATLDGEGTVKSFNTTSTDGKLTLAHVVSQQ